MKNTHARCNLIRYMEAIARATNNEDLIHDIWLLNGVPDGFVDESTPDDQVEWLTEDKYFANIMDAFVTTMFHARIDGGLYFDGVLSAPLDEDEVEPVESEDISTLI